MKPETANATIKNPRWWIALPLVLAIASMLVIGWMLTKPLWWLGQTICGVSNAISPHSTTPAPVKAILDWVRRGQGHNDQVQP